MSTISNIPDLIEALNKVEDQNYLPIMQEMNIPAESFQDYSVWKDEYPTRNCLAKTSNYELVIICWEKGQEGEIHDYNFQQAWIHPISGTIHEEKFIVDPQMGNLVRVSSVHLKKNDFSFMNKAGGIHKYSNANQGRSVSLHLYSRPLSSWRFYDESGESYTKETSYDGYFADNFQIT